MTLSESTRLGRFVWRVEPDFRSALESDVLALLEGRPPADASLCKRTRVREVWHVAAGTGYFVKRYLSPTRRVGLRARLRGSKAKRESQAARALTERGLATVHPLAVGERRGPGVALESVLVTRAIEHDGDLASRLARSDCRGVARRRLLARFGRYLARLHEAGITHPDLHGENLLVLDSHETPFALIDPDGISIRASVSRRRRQASLAIALHALREVTSRADRLRVLRTYLVAAGLPRPEHADYRAAVDGRWRGLERRALRKGTQRALRIGSRFDRIRAGGRRLHWRRSYGRELAEEVLAAHAETVRTGRGSFLKQSRRVRVTLQQVAGDRFVVKESTDTRASTRLRNALLGSRARTAWVGGHALDLRGFATATTVALLERGRLGLVGESAIVTRFRDGMQPLSERFATRYGVGPLTREAIREKRALLRLVARTLARLHAEGIHHHDLSAKNLLVAQEGPVAELVILDLESLRRRPLSRRRRAANLCQVLETLGAGHWSDARRLLRDYGIESPAERTRWLHRIDAMARSRRVRRATRRSRRPRRQGGAAVSRP